MKNFYVNNNAQPNGDHEVHEEGCVFMPSNRKGLGKHSDCETAVQEAKLTYSSANGCFQCSYDSYKN